MKIPLQFNRQLLLFMRISLIQLFISLCFISTATAVDVRAQELLRKKITLHAENQDVKSLLNRLEKQANVRFVFSSKLIQSGRKVSMDQTDRALADVLNDLLVPLGLSYEVSGKNIVIRPKVVESSSSEPKVSASIKAMAVDRVIKGRVSDVASGEGLPGVNVLIKGTQTGTTTDADGNYQLEVPGASSILVFSFVGYESLEAPAGSGDRLDISLTVDLKSLEEVVVVGYGTVKKSDVTGSVSSVKSGELTAYPALGTVQALQGRAAGVQIQATNGEPGAGYKVRIRGGTSINANSDPIYVVDGFVGGTMPPPEDIESIEILKDASATAIYGSRGANGVVMVTTKRGKSGKPRIEFNTSFSSQKEINRLDLLNSEQFLDYIQEIKPTVQSMGADTDWQDEVLRKGGIQNHQLSIAGGNEAVKYYVSGSLYDQKGIIINSDYKRYSLTSNIDIQASSKLKLGLNIFAQRVDRNQSKTQESSGGLTPGVIASAFKFEPDQPIRNAAGAFTVARLNDPIDNPYAIATQLQNSTLSDRLQANFFAEYDIVNDLKFKTTFGATTYSSRTGTFDPTTLNTGRTVGGSATVTGAKNTLLLNENYLTYSKTIGVHDFNVLGGYSIQNSSNESWGGTGQSFITDAVSYWNLGGSSVWKSPTSGLTEWQIASYYARATYSIADRYLFTANIRRDGSSNFSKNNKWATFPSGAFAWKMSNEAFMQNVTAVSQWKWRVSYGLTGNQAIAPYQTMARFSNIFTVINGTAVNAIWPTTVANNDLTWETTTQLDVGTDVSLFNNRLNVTADYYRMVTRDLLFNVQLPQYSGFSTQLQNIGAVENKGFEFTLGTRNLVGNFKWNTDFNLSINRNKVLELPGGTDIMYGSGPGHLVGLNQTQILREGYPVGSFFGWIYDGVYQEGDDFIPGGGFETEAGGEKFRDIDGTKDSNGQLTGVPDGQLNSDDRTIIGNPHPKFTWGLNNDFSYKGFDLNIFLQGSQGNDMLSYTLMELNLLSGINNATTAALDRWTPTNTDTDVPKAQLGRTRRVSTRWVSDGSFVRLKNVSLGYNLPAALLEGSKIRKVRVYFSAQNILTMTKYEGYDPEVNYSSTGDTNSNTNLGLDYGSYPNAKSYTVGLNIGF
ncbi:TonB-linked SusC/RagA family outer membrane protein [Dyadobacter jejuensis]|uniref:TonB-linked SusC/RagA family outer membrane protein n=1 Tax=Dyadobacter jejuensis TaxID=1082580 RepID=A0A316ALU8_9BACT|nr:TonB-dependent receptor [Dyadobacter jejuensis]PWJ58723.1 TonB-linked SusC/RagA family outer membrane protein [Dyadobacter jejuensis]